MGVAACYDLNGRRRWITRVPVESIQYGSSPALADGVLAVFMNRLYGLDAATGKLLWTQPRVRKNIASVLAARLAGRNVFVSQQGEVIRPRDGHLLFRPRGIGTGDTCWSPPVVLGDVVHVPRYGVAQLTLFDFAGCTGDAWKPKTQATVRLPDEIHRGQNGRWIDRWTAGSPLVWQGLSYQTDIYGTLYVADLKSGKLVYRRQLDLAGLMHYNAVPVAASPTLVGRHVVVADNQGTVLVLKPGRQFQQIARNRIATQLDRRGPIPAQETLTYAPPITDGERLYLRGERFLYCIAEK
jgi:outer membrane protein assembly factor BamB